MRSTTHRAERAQATVGFALILPILLMVLFAATQFGKVFVDMQQLSNAASEGARVRPVSAFKPSRTDDIETAVPNAATQ